MLVIYMGGFIFTASHGQTFLSPPAKPGFYLFDYHVFREKFTTFCDQITTFDKRSNIGYHFFLHIAVGSKRFVELTKDRIGIKAKGRRVLVEDGANKEREPAPLYGRDFGPKNTFLRLTNAYF